MSLVQLRTKASPERPRRAQTGLFLPTTREEMEARGWDELDILIVTGDAYVDHPAFGAVAHRPLPRGARLQGRRHRAAATGDSPTTSRAWARRGCSSGVTRRQPRLDAQQAHRAEEGARARISTRRAAAPGCGPNRATIVYANLCRQAFPGVPIVLGGIEASLRRIAHYDYWSRPGAPLDPARRQGRPAGLRHGRAPGLGDRASGSTTASRSRELRDVRGTAYVMTQRREWEPLAADRSRYVTDGKVVVLPVVRGGRRATSARSREMSRAFQYETNPGNARPLLQRARRSRRSTSTRPALPLDEARRWTSSTTCRSRARRTRRTRRAHPRVRDGEALDRDDARLLRRLHVLLDHRARGARHPEPLGRAACCARCARCARMDDFRGVDHRSRRPDRQHVQDACKDEAIESACRRLSCVHPGICENLETDHGPLIELMKQVREEQGIKNVFIASGVRYDLAERSPEFIARARARTTPAGSSRSRPSTTSPTCSTR